MRAENLDILGDPGVGDGSKGSLRSCAVDMEKTQTALEN